MLGLRIVVDNPIATYKTVMRQGKSKVGKRWVRVRKFTGFCHLIKEGEPMLDKANRVCYMHPTDANRLRKYRSISNNQILSPFSF